MLLENLTEAGIHYLPDFINELEEKKLLEHVYTAPKPKWHRLLNRRLQNWGGMVGGNQCLIQDEPLPTVCLPINRRNNFLKFKYRIWKFTDFTSF